MYRSRSTAVLRLAISNRTFRSLAAASLDSSVLTRYREEQRSAALYLIYQ